MTEMDAVGSCFSLGGFPLQNDELKRHIRYSGGQASSAAKERCPLEGYAIWWIHSTPHIMHSLRTGCSHSKDFTIPK